MLNSVYLHQFPFHPFPIGKRLGTDETGGLKHPPVFIIPSVPAQVGTVGNRWERMGTDGTDERAEGHPFPWWGQRQPTPKMGKTGKFLRVGDSDLWPLAGTTPGGGVGCEHTGQGVHRQTSAAGQPVTEGRPCCPCRWKDAGNLCPYRRQWRDQGADQRVPACRASYVDPVGD